MLRFVVLLVGLVAAGRLAAQTTCPVTVDSLVVDPDGAPVAGVRFGDCWGVRGGEWVPRFVCPNPTDPLVLTSDANGRIRGSWTLAPFGEPLLGISEDGRFAVFVSPEWDEQHHAVTPARITLAPAVRLSARVRTAAEGPASASATLRWSPDAAAATAGMFRVGFAGGAFELPLPPGRFELTVGCRFGVADARSEPRTVVLRPGGEQLDIGPVTVPLPQLARIGELLPDWRVDTAVRIDAVRARLADFRGRPLLVVLDTFCEGTHVGVDLPRQLGSLAQDAEAHEFGIVLFDTSRLRRWSKDGPECVRELPWPVVADSTHVTADRLGTRWAAVVLDADGRLLHASRDLASALAKLRR